MKKKTVIILAALTVLLLSVCLGAFLFTKYAAVSDHDGSDGASVAESSSPEIPSSEENSVIVEPVSSSKEETEVFCHRSS